MSKTPKRALPPYISQIYSWIYTNLNIYNFLDNPIVLNILTLGSNYYLTEELKKEISPNSHILQTGVTLGSQIEKTYSVLNSKGSYDIIDINPIVLDNFYEKHLEQHINLINADLTKPIKKKYDTIICYMLLHELPPLTTQKILDNIIKSLTPGGKAIFIDYHRPSSYNPLKYLQRAFNRLYQPFAEKLWDYSIKELMPKSNRCQWSQQTYYGGMYQKVVATKTN